MAAGKREAAKDRGKDDQITCDNQHSYTQGDAPYADALRRGWNNARVGQNYDGNSEKLYARTMFARNGQAEAVLLARGG